MREKMVHARWRVSGHVVVKRGCQREDNGCGTYCCTYSREFARDKKSTAVACVGVWGNNPAVDYRQSPTTTSHQQSSVIDTTAFYNSPPPPISSLYQPSHRLLFYHPPSHHTHYLQLNFFTTNRVNQTSSTSAVVVPPQHLLLLLLYHLRLPSCHIFRLISRLRLQKKGSLLNGSSRRLAGFCCLRIGREICPRSANQEGGGGGVP